MKRRVFSRRTHRPVLAALLACAMILPTLASASDKREAARGKAAVTLKNFGRVNDHIYRGGQPQDDDYRQLVALGVKTVVDLRGDSESGSRAAAEKVGLRYINLPLAPKRYPQADTAQRFLEIVNDQANWPVYVHYAGGRHRTGAMLAVYRMEVDGWDIQRAYQEMKDYDYYTWMGHGAYKEYVYDYHRNLQARHQAQPSSGAKTVVATEQRD